MNDNQPPKEMSATSTTTRIAKKSFFDLFTQFALPTLTIGSQVFIAIKKPEIGVLVNLAAQPFWIYSAYKSYKEAGQIGILLTAVIFLLVLMYGAINYWFL